MVRNGCGQSGHGTQVDCTVSEEWAVGITGFLYVDTDSQKLKSDQKSLGGLGKNGCGQSGLWILKLIIPQKWTGGVNWIFAC